MKRWFLILTVAALPHGSAAARDSDEAPADAVAVERVRKDGKTYFEISASGFARATPRTTWRVLTDYDRLAQFVPSLESSKLVSRDGNEAIVEQTGKAGFLFISHSIHMALHVVEKPTSTIDIALLSGDMKHYASHWTIAPARREGSNGSLISYAGVLEPNFFVPPILGPSLIRSDMRAMLAAVIKEIETTEGTTPSSD